MRVSALIAVAAVALACGVGAGCSRPTDLTIGVHLRRQPEPPQKCVVSFDNSDLKKAKHAVAYTGFKVKWEVTKNDCGDLTKGMKKALGLKDLKFKGQTAKWIKNCTELPFVPGRFSSPPTFLCNIPKAEEGDIVGLYVYEIDGDSVEPQDPDLDVKRGG